MFVSLVNPNVAFVFEKLIFFDVGFTKNSSDFVKFINEFFNKIANNYKIFNP